MRYGPASSSSSVESWAALLSYRAMEFMGAGLGRKVDGTKLEMPEAPDAVVSRAFRAYRAAQ
jgi:hypothetical protein